MAACTLPGLPYSVVREWNSAWDESIVPMLKADRVVPPGEGVQRYFHADLEIRVIEGRGRGVVASRELPAGELLLFDTPLVTAHTHGELVDQAVGRARDNVEFRCALLSMCADSTDEEKRQKLDAPPMAKLVSNIVRHNYHGVDAPPVDGETPGGCTVVGLWPLGSLVNHSLRPNVARAFIGHCACYRLIRKVEAGGEILDNYLDLTLPMATRQNMMQNSHAMTDEGPDANDAPPSAVQQLRAAYESAKENLDSNEQEVVAASLQQLAEVTNKIQELVVVDPAFTYAFRDFAHTLGQFGEAKMCLQGYAMSVEFATAREPYSVISYILALRMLQMSVLAAGPVEMVEDEEGGIGSDTRKRLEDLARQHLRTVYGPWPGVFEALNPLLTLELTKLRPKDVQMTDGY